jgi:phage shock protein A
MQARAGAVDELIASGALDDMTQVGGHDDISRELEAMSSQSDVESELAPASRPGPRSARSRVPLGR